MIHSTKTPFSGLTIRTVVMAVLAISLLAGCATVSKTPEPTTPVIGPYPAFSGRLLVIEPNKRWQVSIDWHAEQPDTGELRLTHAASGTVIELNWQKPDMQLRDSRHPRFRSLASAELAAQGLFLPPWTLASILLGNMPPEFEETRTGEWQAHLNDALVRLQWQQQEKRLTLTDITHGRQATLIITP